MGADFEVSSFFLSREYEDAMCIRSRFSAKIEFSVTHYLYNRLSLTFLLKIYFDVLLLLRNVTIRN